MRQHNNVSTFPAGICSLPLLLKSWRLGKKVYNGEMYKNRKKDKQEYITRTIQPTTPINIFMAELPQASFSSSVQVPHRPLFPHSKQHKCCQSKSSLNVLQLGQLKWDQALTCTNHSRPSPWCAGLWRGLSM